MRKLRSTMIVAATFALMTQGAVCFTGPLSGLLGPPAVHSTKAYADQPGGQDRSKPAPRTASVDHTLLNELLGKFVDDAGGVDYAGLKKNDTLLNQYILSIAKAPRDQLGRDERLALLINAYNAFTLRLILDYYPIQSIRKIPAAKRWDDRRWRIGGQLLSLDQIEHEEIRPKFHEPRIHFALVCAAVGCPMLRNEAYRADAIDEQLEDQTKRIHASHRWFRFDRESGTVTLTKLYKWYGKDFEQAAGSVTAFAARYSDELGDALAAKRRIKIRWLDYDWSLNEGKG